MWLQAIVRALSTVSGMTLYVLSWAVVAYFAISVVRRLPVPTFPWLAAYAAISAVHLFLLPSVFPRHDPSVLLSPRIFLQGLTHFIAFVLVLSELASWLPESRPIFPQAVSRALGAIRQRCWAYGLALVIAAVAWACLDIYISTHYPIPKA